MKTKLLGESKHKNKSLYISKSSCQITLSSFFENENQRKHGIVHQVKRGKWFLF